MNNIIKFQLRKSRNSPGFKKERGALPLGSHWHRHALPPFPSMNSALQCAHHHKYHNHIEQHRRGAHSCPPRGGHDHGGHPFLKRDVTKVPHTPSTNLCILLWPCNQCIAKQCNPNWVSATWSLPLSPLDLSLTAILNLNPNPQVLKCIHTHGIYVNRNAWHHPNPSRNRISRLFNRLIKLQNRDDDGWHHAWTLLLNLWWIRNSVKYKTSVMIAQVNHRLIRSLPRDSIHELGGFYCEIEITYVSSPNSSCICGSTAAVAAKAQSPPTLLELDWRPCHHRRGTFLWRGNMTWHFAHLLSFAATTINILTATLDLNPKPSVSHILIAHPHLLVHATTEQWVPTSVATSGSRLLKHS